MIDFVREVGPRMLDAYNREYGEFSVTDDSYEDMEKNADAYDYIFPARCVVPVTFGDESGDVIGRVFDYMLREEGESDNFKWILTSCRGSEENYDENWPNIKKEKSKKNKDKSVEEEESYIICVRSTLDPSHFCVGVTKKLAIDQLTLELIVKLCADDKEFVDDITSISVGRALRLAASEKGIECFIYPFSFDNAILKI